MPGTPSSHENGCVVWSVSLLGKGCCNRVKVGKAKVFRHGQGTAALHNLWWKGMGRPGLYFRLCYVFSRPRWVSCSCLCSLECIRMP